MIIPKDKIALLDMHNDTAFAVECILRCSKDGTPMATVQASLDGFLETATDEQKAIYAQHQDQIKVFPNLIT